MVPENSAIYYVPGNVDREILEIDALKRRQHRLNWTVVERSEKISHHGSAKITIVLLDGNLRINATTVTHDAMMNITKIRIYRLRMMWGLPVWAALIMI